jgi:hypothetical protein
LLAVLAFIASFILGLGRGRDERPAPAPVAAPQPLAVPDSRVRVQVLNGSRKPGLARLATDQLRAAGFDVVNIGNAPRRTANSIVLDRVGRRASAERVASALAITRIETRVDTALYLEVTVILGPDWVAKQQ